MTSSGGTAPSGAARMPKYPIQPPLQPNASVAARDSGEKYVTSWYVSTSTHIVRLLVKVLLQPLDLRGDLPGVPGPDVGLEHQAHPRRRRLNRIHGLFDHGHHLVPLTLDLGEHGTGGVGQTGRTNNPDRLGDRLGDTVGLTPERAHAERDQHEHLPSYAWARCTNW